MRRTIAYNRVLVKLSGESFGSGIKSIDPLKLAGIARELVRVKKLGCEIAVVVGGGNLWRKREQGKGMNAITADYLGMLATVMNGLALKQELKKIGAAASVQSYLAKDTPGIEPINATKARRSIKKQIIIYVSGTGKPFVTTDTAAAIHAASIKAEAIIKVGPADGVYSADPKKNRRAKMFVEISASEAIGRKLGFMDLSALKLCSRSRISVIVCRWHAGVLAQVILGKSIGTMVAA